MKFQHLLIVLISLVVLSARGQDEPIYPTHVGTGTFIGISQPLRDLPELTAEEMAIMKAKADLKLLNPKLRNREYPYAATAYPKGPDPAWQKEHVSSREAGEPNIVFQGQNSPYYPPDCNGTAGPNHYMQTVNTTYAIYNKAGTKLAGPTNMNLLFGNVQGSNCNDGDPIVLYDEQADRWFAAEFALCTNPDRMLIAVSTTNDPTGTWYQYSFAMNGMPDYMKFGIWHDGYYMGTNTSSGSDIYVFERSVILAGGQNPKMISFDNAWRPGSVDGFMMVPPIDCDGTPPPATQPGMFIAQQDDAFGGGADQLWIYELNANWTTTTSSTFQRVQQLNVLAYDSNFGNNWNNIKQPGTSQKLDAIPQVIMNVPQYRNWGSYQSIVCCHTVDVDATDHAGIRWYELRKTGSSPWTVRQTGTYAPDAHSRWMGSVSMNGSKEIGLAYSISSTTEYPGIRFTGQTEEQYLAASGIMDAPEGIIHTGTASQTGANRWGDYALLSIDPADDETFWFTSQYESGGRKTKIASFNIGPLGPTVNFQVSNNKPCLNETTTFSDMSTGNPISWQWSFSPATVTFVNGTSASSKNPQVQFNAYGNYDVTLTATNAGGTNSKTNLSFVLVNEANAQFSASLTSVVVNNPLVFTDMSTCNVTSYNWNFGEGAMPATANTAGPHTVIYNTTGNKTVTLTVNGQFTETKTNYITVIPDYFVMNNSTITSCSGTFVDPGGNLPYGNNLNYTMVLYPSQAGGQVSLNFTEFNLEPSTDCVNDYLAIYNGKNTFAPPIGKYCGTDSPGTITADNTWGALTLVFRSNASVTASGWSAEVSCGSVVINPLDLAAIAYTDTRIELGWLLNPDGNNVMLVYSDNPTIGTPVSGTAYSVGNTLPGGGTVLYVGNSNNFSHLNLTPATTYYYKAFSINGENLYSSGVTASATTMAEPPTISVNPLTLTVPALSGTSSVNVVSNTAWTAVSNEPWCIVTPGGNGTGMLQVNYTSNIVALERSAIITVSVLGLEPVVVNVIQVGAAPTLSLTPTNFFVGTEAGSADVEINSNAQWTVTSNADWCVPTPSGFGDGIISLVHQENTWAAERTATVIVSVNGLSDQSIVLTQAAAIPVLVVEPLLANVPATPGSVDFNINANFNWTTTTDASWITIPTNGSGSGIMNAQYSANMTFVERSAVITIHGNEIQQELSVIQAAGEAVVYVSPMTPEVTYLAGTTNLTVTSNADWTATDDADWTTITASGSGNGTIVVDYAQNPLHAQRIANISVAVAGKTPVVVQLKQRESEVGIEENTLDGIRIYPNPATTQFVIEANKTMYPQMTVRVVDPSGNTVLTKECTGKERYSFDVTNIAAGTYSINIITTDKNISRKVVIIK